MIGQTVAKRLHNKYNDASEGNFFIVQSYTISTGSNLVHIYTGFHGSNWFGWTPNANRRNKSDSLSFQLIQCKPGGGPQWWLATSLRRLRSRLVLEVETCAVFHWWNFGWFVTLRTMKFPNLLIAELKSWRCFGAILSTYWGNLQNGKQ